jgi:hypothetical protein
LSVFTQPGPFAVIHVTARPRFRIRGRTYCQAQQSSELSKMGQGALERNS